MLIVAPTHLQQRTHVAADQGASFQRHACCSGPASRVEPEGLSAFPSTIIEGSALVMSERAI